MKLHGKQTKRLKFIALNETHVPWWQTFMEDPSCLQFMPFLEGGKDAAEVWIQKQMRRYESEGYGLYGLQLVESGELVGQCGLLYQDLDWGVELEIGYHLLPDYRGHGYASEAARFCKEHAFENKLRPYVISLILAGNEASKHVARANGMTLWREHEYKGEQVHVFRTDDD